MLRQAYANECKHILGGKQRAVFKNRPSEFFRNSDGSYFRRIDYEHQLQISSIATPWERITSILSSQSGIPSVSLPI